MKTLDVKAVLRGKDVKKFRRIKKHYGVEHNSEGIRICVNRTYAHIFIPKEANPR